MATSDPWFKDLGKTVTLMKQKPSYGGGIDTSNYFDKKTPKSRQVSGKIVGTNGGGQVVIMFDKTFDSPGYSAHYAATPNMSNIAMEFRDEVLRASGQNRFITLAINHAHIFEIGELATPKEKTKKVESDDRSQTFMEMFKSDAEDAAFRVASDKIAEGVRNMLSLVLMSQLGENATAASVQAVLSTPLGVALVQGVAGYALTYAPKKVSSDPRVKRLAKEFRVAGMAKGMGSVADTLMNKIEPLIASALEMPPGGEEKADSKVRVTEHVPSRNNVVEITQAEEEDSETEKSSSQRMVAGASSR